MLNEMNEGDILEKVFGTEFRFTAIGDGEAYSGVLLTKKLSNGGVVVLCSMSD